MYAEMAKTHGKNKPFIYKIVKKGKNLFQFAIVHQTKEVMATVRGKCLLKMEEALHLYKLL